MNESISLSHVSEYSDSYTISEIFLLHEHTITTLSPPFKTINKCTKRIKFEGFEMDLSSITNYIQETAISAAALIAGVYIGFKKTLKHGSKEELDTVKAKAERDVIILISERLKELESINEKLTRELELIRKEYITAQLQNNELRGEIMNLKLFIEKQFSATA